MLRKWAVKGVMEQARQILGPVLRPERTKITDYKTFIQSGARGEIDILATLDEEFSGNRDSLRFETRVEKEASVALVMDASLSMKGEKIALLAVSAAVVSLCVPVRNLSLMGFDSSIRWVKKFKEELTVENIIERVLELPAGGFTNIEEALKETANALHTARKEHANVILISDGKYTEGADPTDLGKNFRHLNVLKIGRDQAGRELLLDLTHSGNGKFFEARKIQELPKTMYNALKTIL